MKVHSLFHFFLKKVGTFVLILSVVMPLSLVQLPTPVLADKAGVCATPGKDGPTTMLSGVVNSYYPGTANVAATATSIPVGAVRAGGGPAIAAGDLLLVVQMQGADLNGNNDEQYGDGQGTLGTTGPTVVYSTANAYAGGNLGTNFSAGFYEYVVATGPVAAGSIPISSGLVNNYYSAAYNPPTQPQGQRTFQVIRVPQYSSATLNGTVTALRWDGSTGGIVVFDVAGQLNWNGNTVDVSTLGFRGGGGRALGPGGAGANTDYRTLSTNNANGSKGEGYAGTPRYLNNNGVLLTNTAEGFLNGSYGRGASGNGGGGSTDGRPSNNDENSGGGGGGNGGFGGMGGNAWNSGVVSGGFGGAPFPGSAPRLILGGGGGAGTTNNATGTPGAGFASSGAAGGGVVMIRAGTISGTGTINANGATANQTVLNDGSGGGGAGGSVVVIARNGNGNVGTLTVTAVGGNGGVAWPLQAGAINRHGPGGGGGGGFVYTSGTLVTGNVNGGLNGTSTTANDPFGATPGGIGTLVTNVTPASIPDSISGANCVPVNLTTIKTTSTPNVVAGNTATYTIKVSNTAGAGGASGVIISDTLPTGFTYASTISIVRSGNATRTSISDPDPTVPGSPSWGTFIIPNDGSVEITFSVNVSGTTPAGTYQNPATTTYADPTRTSSSTTLTSSYASGSSTNEDVTVTNPGIAILKTPAFQSVASGGTANFSITVTNTGSSTLSNVTVTDPNATGCARTIGTLAVGAFSTYACSVTNVTTGFTNVATATGTAGGIPLTAASAGAVVSISGTPTCGLPMVSWGFESGVTGTSPNYDTKAADVTTAVAAAGAGLTQAIAGGGVAPTAANRWQATDFAAGALNLGNNDYFQFALDAANYTSLTLTFDARTRDGGGGSGPTSMALYYSLDGTTFNPVPAVYTVPNAWGMNPMFTTNLSALTGLNNNPNAAFRLYGYNASSTSGSGRLDNVTFTGCKTPLPPSISKAFSPASITVNGNSTLTFTITNPNTTTALNGVAFNDTYPSGLVNGTPASGTTTCSGGSVTAANGMNTISLSGGTIAANGTCTVTVNVIGTSSGRKNNTSGTVSSTNGGTGNAAIDTLSVVAIDAVNDTGAVVNGVIGGQSLSNVLANDTLNGLQATLSNVNLTQVSTDNPNVTLNPATGSVNVAAGTSNGTFNVVYRICDKTNPTFCDTATVTVSVQVVDAVNDTGTTINSAPGGTSIANVLANDTLNGAAATTSNVTITAVGTWPSGVTLNTSTGAVSVASGTAAGTYTPQYQICSQAAPSICDTATVTVPVVTIDAVNDTGTTIDRGTGGTSISNVLVNDTLNGVAATTSNVDITTVGTWPAGVTLNTSTGAVSIALGTAAGTYTPQYQICDKANPTICDTATVTVTVTDLPKNFGHLPSSYTGMNLLAEGGAYHLTDTTTDSTPATATHLGALVTTASDGINNATYQAKASDDGVTWTPGVAWTAGGTGSVDITATCTTQPCYLYAWFDWNQDGDFGDTDEVISFLTAPTHQISDTVAPITTTFTTTLTFNIPASANLNGSTFYSRFRIYPSEPTNPAPNGAALNGTTLLAGEIEDPFFKITSGSVPTPVTVAYFLAKRQGNLVNFDWSTSTETGNVGFNLYVANGNKKTLINTQLIPSKVIDSLNRQDYTFSATVTVKGGSNFFIEDVSVAGETELFGPFQNGKEYGGKVAVDKIDLAAIQAEHEKKYDDQQEKLEQQITIPAAVRKLEIKPVRPMPTTVKPIKPTPMVKPVKPTATVKPIRPMPTAKPVKPTPTVKSTKTPNLTATAAPTMTVVPTATATATPSHTPTATETPTETSTAIGEPTPTVDSVVTDEPTATATYEPTATATFEPTATATFEPTATVTYEPTATATYEPTATATFEPTATATFEPTATATYVPTATATLVPASGAVDPNTLQLTTTLNLKVRKTGIYRVTYEMLKDAGLDLIGVPTANIALINRGLIIPIYMTTQTGSFGPGDYFDFYGEVLDTIYTDTNVYTVQVSSIPVLQIQKDSVAPDMALVVPVSYTETLKVNNQRKFSNTSPSVDAWYDTGMLTYTTLKSWSFPFQVNGLIASTTPSTLELNIWGATDFPASPDHHARISVNGVSVADETFNGIVEKIIKVSLPVGTLREGANTIEITMPGDTGVAYDLVYLDKFNITYQRTFQATNGNLTFTAAGDVFSVANLANANVAVYRMNAAGLTRIENINVQASGSTFTATFAGSSQPATYLVSAAPLTPVLEASRLKADLNRPAQYLIISHPDFIAGLQPLIQARQAQGLTVSVVDVNDLYAQYNDGIFNPQAIKKYIAYAAQNLGTQYVLLVGGDTYDYRNYLGKNSISFIPSIYVTTGDIAKFVPADPVYTDVNSDNIPDLAIGRFPVRTTAELNLMITKTLAYANKNYGRTAIFAADANDGVVSFKDISTGMAAGLPSGWTAKSIHLDNTLVADASTQLIAAMNNGSALVTFTGHSSPTTWTFSGLFNTTNASALTNNGRPFTLVQWGCWNTYYVDPVNNYLVQKFLFSGNQGAAAVFGAITLTDSESERLLGEQLMPRLTAPGMPMGKAMQDAKVELAKTHPELLDVLLGWTLMGDPALVVEP